VAAIVSMWAALVALTSLVVREAGWSRLRRYSLTIACLALALLVLPGAAVVKLGLPYKDRILARLIRHHSPPVDLSGGCSVFPQDNVWNVRISGNPVDAKSQVYVQSMGPNLPLHADFGPVGGIPYGTTSGNQPITDVTLLDGAAESDRGPYRIPDDAPIEPGADSHVLIVDRGECRLYELYGAARTGSQQWRANSGAIFDLKSNQLRPEGWTSADAAGLPIFAGLLRYDEVKSGRISHALRFSTPHTRRAFVWPARHFASSSSDPNLPPMGQRFRLRGSFDLSRVTAEARVILNALKEYGMFLADNGGPWFLTGTPDSRWDSRTISDLRSVSGSDFEAVDSSIMMIDRNSGQARR